MQAESIKTYCGANPFVAVTHGKSPRGITCDEVLRLALVVRCAHQPSDIAAGCRVERALRGYNSPRSVGDYLNGHAFARWVIDGEIIRLDELREHANAYLQSVGL